MLSTLQHYTLAATEVTRSNNCNRNAINYQKRRLKRLFYALKFTFLLKKLKTFKKITKLFVTKASTSVTIALLAYTASVQH